MAKQLSKTDILDGQLATAAQVTQSIDALTGDDGYDITISGSLVVTGSTDLNGNLAITGFPNVSASLASSGVGNGFPFTGSAAITGSLNIVGNITASGDISSSVDVHGQKFISNGKNVISYNTANDTVTVNSSLGNLFLSGNITASSTGQGNISASGDVFGDRLVVGTRVETPRVSVGDGTQLFVGDTQGMRLEGPVTASTHISSSGDLTSNKLTVASNEINFTNLPTSDPGVVGRLYRDGGDVKISI